jgi:hypothetical protein
MMCLSQSLFSQDSAVKKNAFSFSGYIKSMGWVGVDKEFLNASATTLLHNRINIQWKSSANWSGRLDLRNRLYWGDDVREIPHFKQQLRNENETVDLSANWFATRSALLHTNIERLWLEYKKQKWNIRAGRQRINWGITNTWNPNDLFNTYNFLDFDYEERPGIDAVKAQYFNGELSNLELAVAGNGHDPIIAAKYFTNYHQYDLQWNAGVYQKTVTAGFGWAGNIKDLGFKGEAQFYVDNSKTLSQVMFLVEGDYIFKNGWYISSAFLYNQKALDRPLNDWAKLTFQASTRNLMPTKWNLLVNTSKEFSPLFSGSLNIVYAPGVNLLILFPTLRYNIKTNWDLDFIWKSFFAETDKFEALSHTGYLRIRWSF